VYLAGNVNYQCIFKKIFFNYKYNKQYYFFTLTHHNYKKSFKKEEEDWSFFLSINQSSFGLHQPFEPSKKTYLDSKLIFSKCDVQLVYEFLDTVCAASLQLV
jgi:hypothetical protein